MNAQLPLHIALIVRRTKMSRLLSSPRRYARAAFYRARSFITSQPKLQRAVLVIITKLGLYGIVSRCYVRLTMASQRLGVRDTQIFVPKDITHLSSRARRIHADLEAAIEKRGESH